MASLHSDVSKKKVNYNALEWLDEDVDFLSQEESQDGFAALFKAQEESQSVIKEGQVVKGRVIEIKDDSVVVDIGHKSAGEIPKSEFTAENGTFSLKVNDIIDVFVDVFEDDEGELVLSKDKADMLKAWDRISEAFEKDELVEGKIVGRVKGGLSVDIGVKAFLPGSQVDLRPVRNLEKLLGQVLQFKIIKFNKKRGNIVLSRRVLLEQDRERMRSETLKGLQVGSSMIGIVKNITDYGAFIDLGGIDGLLHITDMSWGRLNSPSEVLNVGDEINVKVLSFDPSSNRVSLGLKQLQNDPWISVAEKYASAQRLRGKVVSLTDYGAFVELEPGVEGLIHVTEMTWNRRIKHPSKIVNIGDEVDVVVLAVDLENHRISLGMKQTEPNPWEIVTQKYQVNDVIRGKIRNITDFGIFVGIEEGVDGLIHVSDISYTERIKHPQDLYKKGDEVEAKVLQIDVENMRFSLGIKQLGEDPYEVAAKKMLPGTKAKGKVTRLAEFGAFVDIAPGVEGLIHTSELENPNVAVDAEVEFVILSADFAERRFELSQKAATRGLDDSHNKTIQSALSGDASSQNSFAEAFARAKATKDNN
ncbi:30S ribosomal protein S1 [Pigmentibacter sp. JX0631]|uniref:30S ribosomal protein S1 n=1 Tax=Pigmentibacter sp. JX0631 TaxID=2976982 RepID=UPI00246952D0|nr:30S ribosomal protein S1 [Pigmentibacter sp. JX0631]WGL59924.1 30S ribosomal protein S1 [Pigmentibacter sp. JX0631]